jgi:hypothetical protein
MMREARPDAGLRLLDDWIFSPGYKIAKSEVFNRELLSLEE